MPFAIFHVVCMLRILLMDPRILLKFVEALAKAIGSIATPTALGRPGRPDGAWPPWPPLPQMAALAALAA